MDWQLGNFRLIPLLLIVYKISIIRLVPILGTNLKSLNIMNVAISNTNIYKAQSNGDDSRNEDSTLIDITVRKDTDSL